MAVNESGDSATSRWRNLFWLILRLIGIGWVLLFAAGAASSAGFIGGYSGGGMLLIAPLVTAAILAAIVIWTYLVVWRSPRPTSSSRWRGWPWVSALGVLLLITVQVVQGTTAGSDAKQSFEQYRLIENLKPQSGAMGAMHDLGQMLPVIVIGQQVSGIELGLGFIFGLLVPVTAIRLLMRRRGAAPSDPRPAPEI
jgi:hypothetical protein